MSRDKTLRAALAGLDAALEKLAGAGLSGDPHFNLVSDKIFEGREWLEHYISESRREARVRARAAQDLGEEP